MHTADANMESSLSAESMKKIFLLVIPLFGADEWGRGAMRIPKGPEQAGQLKNRASGLTPNILSWRCSIENWVISFLGFV